MLELFNILNIILIDYWSSDNTLAYNTLSVHLHEVHSDFSTSETFL